MSRKSMSGNFKNSAKYSGKFGNSGSGVYNANNRNNNLFEEEMDKQRYEYANEIGVNAETLDNSYAQEDRSVTHDYVHAQQQLAQQQKKHSPCSK